MIYYRVKKECDGLPKVISPFATYGRCDGTLIADELYTKKERKELFISDGCFEKIKIPKNKTYLLFGARFGFND